MHLGKCLRVRDTLGEVGGEVSSERWLGTQQLGRRQLCKSQRRCFQTQKLMVGRGGFGLGEEGCGSVCRREGAQRDREREKEIWVMLPPKD